MSEFNSEVVYDVVICGAGMAGQTLARQIKREMPNKTVVMVDRLTRPLPDVAFKVGESTAEADSYYLGVVLGLNDYFKENHFLKMGLRYFFQSEQAHEMFESRPEYGLVEFPKVGSYTLDRGKFENDLRQFNQQDGVILLEGYRIRDMKIAEGDEAHELTIRQDGGEEIVVKGHWLIDATGRGRMLQRRLGLSRKRGQSSSSVWFRVRGKVDVSDFVADDNTEWHDRVPNRTRMSATTHLMGKGYWIWIIPLPNDYTSIGITSLEGLQNFDERNTLPRAMDWLQAHEPFLATYLQNFEILDFKTMRNISYTAQKVFSSQRWASAGEAAAFADPFYAPGTDLIAFGNTIITEMIRREENGTLTPTMVREFNTFYLGLNDSMTDSIQTCYPFMDNGTVMTAKLLWDATAAWSFVTPRMFNSYYLDTEKSNKIRAITSSFFSLTRRMNQFFLDWGSLPKGRLTFEFINYLAVPYLAKLRKRNLQVNKSIEELIADQHENMRVIEELAQVLFLVALEDVMPEERARFVDPVWLNAWKISIDPNKWEEEGLFEPKSEPRNLTPLYEEVLGLFKVHELA